MTLLVTIETVVCVLLPFTFRHYCTRRLSVILLLSCFIVSSGLHSTFVFTHTVQKTITALEHSSSTGSCYWIAYIHSMHIYPGTTYEIYEKLYYWTQMTCSIVLPTVAMLVCSLLIVTQFTFKELGEAFSQRRRCVIMITVATTFTHLLFEGPALLTFGAVALKGAGSGEHNPTMCMINHGNNVLSIVNATIPFFVYLICNKQFRHMASTYMEASFTSSPARKRVLLAQACARTRSVTARSNGAKHSPVQLTVHTRSSEVCSRIQT